MGLVCPARSCESSAMRLDIQAICELEALSAAAAAATKSLSSYSGRGDCGTRLYVPARDLTAAGDPTPCNPRGEKADAHVEAGGIMIGGTSGTRAPMRLEVSLSIAPGSPGESTRADCSALLRPPRQRLWRLGNRAPTPPGHSRRHQHGSKRALAQGRSSRRRRGWRRRPRGWRYRPESPPLARGAQQGPTPCPRPRQCSRSPWPRVPLEARWRRRACGHPTRSRQ
eukprot:scaffold13449_cov28-Tisochrysis_lutea.AAC.3